MVGNQKHATFTDSNITANLTRIREKITGACNRYGRGVNDVRLVAVSKTRPVDAVRTAVEAGQLDFGENQVQDALTKIPRFENAKLNWHFIGPLQSNKARHIPGNFNWWHTLSRVDIAQRVSNKAITIGETVYTLIQVNVTDDPAKSGVSTNEFEPLLDELLKKDLKGIRLRGLMTIGPHGGSEAELRECFSKLRRLLEANQQRFDLADFDQLSMGMTDDMELAIAEGSTIVRVGSAIFGSR